MDVKNPGDIELIVRAVLQSLNTGSLSGGRRGYSNSLTMRWPPPMRRKRN